ncbi:TPA: DUF551 domain-containing protein [Pseudomonas aeruginosa]
MSQWIDVTKQLPPIRKILSEPCQIDGQEVPHLYRSVEVICWDGKRVSGGIVEWFHGQKPLSGVTHWMPLPEQPETSA